MGNWPKLFCFVRFRLVCGRRGSGGLELLAEGGESLAGGIGRDVGPKDRSGKVAKSDDTGFAFIFPESGKHAAHAEVEVGSNNVRAPGFGAEDISSGQLVDLVGGDVEMCYAGEINDLAEVRAEPRIGRKPIHVSGQIG